MIATSRTANGGSSNARAASHRQQGQNTIAYIDIDDFKDVNDRFGHHTGDRLLCLISSVLQGQIRRVDTVARVGGDEFALLLPEMEIESAQRMLSDVKRYLVEELEKAGWPITFSIGAVTFAQPPDSVDEVIKSADHLMYAAKRGGKNTIRYAIFDSTTT